MIGVGDDGLTHDLTCLVALARDQQNIASLEVSGRHCDGIGPACNLYRAGRAAMIACRIMAGSSLRGLSSVT